MNDTPDQKTVGFHLQSADYNCCIDVFYEKMESPYEKKLSFVCRIHRKDVPMLIKALGDFIAL
jgi:hypothetical protein